MKAFTMGVCFLCISSICWGAIGVNVDVAQWDVSGGAGQWQSPLITITNTGDEAAKVNIRAMNTGPAGWTLAAAPGLNTFAMQYGDGSTWNPMQTADATLFSTLGAGLNNTFYLKYQSPTSINPITTDVQSSVVTVSVVSGLAAEWMMETVDSCNCEWPVSIAVDSMSYPHILYMENNFMLKYAKWTGSEWIIQSIEYASSSPVTLCLDKNDVPHIAYFNPSDSSLRYAKWTGSQWLFSTISDDCRDQFISIITDNSNIPHVLYGANTGGVNCVKWTGSQWEVEQDNLPGEIGVLKVDSNDHLHIISFGNGSCELNTWTGTEWVTEGFYGEGDEDNPESCGNISFDLDSNDNPHIVYYGEGGGTKYAQWTGSEWNITLLDPDLLNYAILDLDTSDVPFVSYKSTSGTEILSRHWTGSGWQTQTLVSDAQYDYPQSMIIDKNNNMHISYIGEIGNNLKYAGWK